MQKNEYREVVSSPVMIPANKKILDHLADPAIGFVFANLLLAKHEYLSSLDSIGLNAAIERIILDMHKQ